MCDRFTTTVRWTECILSSSSDHPSSSWLNEVFDLVCSFDFVRLRPRVESWLGRCPKPFPRVDTSLALRRWLDRERWRSRLLVVTVIRLLRPLNAFFPSLTSVAMAEMELSLDSTWISISLTTRISLDANVSRSGQKMGMEAAMTAMLTSRTPKM